MVASEALEVPNGHEGVKVWARVGILVLKSWPMVTVSPPTVRLPSRLASPETLRSPKLALVAKRLVEEAGVEKKEVVVALVPVALVKVRMEKSPMPEKEPLTEALVKLPPSLRRVRAEEKLSTSLVDWRVTVGRVSARRISSRRTVVLKVGPD